MVVRDDAVPLSQRRVAAEPVDVGGRRPTVEEDEGATVAWTEVAHHDRAEVGQFDEPSCGEVGRVDEDREVGVVGVGHRGVRSGGAVGVRLRGHGSGGVVGRHAGSTAITFTVRAPLGAS